MDNRNERKMSISEFTSGQSTMANAYMIQDLFLHIPVRDLYLTLINERTQNQDIHYSVGYLNAFIELEKKVPQMEKITIGELLNYAEKHCMTQEGVIGEAAVQLGNKIVKFLLLEIFRPYFLQKKYTYESVCQKMESNQKVMKKRIKR